MTAWAIHNSFNTATRKCQGNLQLVVLKLSPNTIRMDSHSKESEARTVRRQHSRGRKFSTVANLPKLHGSDK